MAPGKFINRRKHILVISGSLRKASFTTALCRAVCGLQIEGTKFVMRDYVRTVPMYDGDLDTDSPPIEVADMRREIAESHAVLIGTPVYNYNIPGGIKNVVDWASRPFAKHSLIGRRVGVFGCSPGDSGGKQAVEYLRQITPLLGGCRWEYRPRLDQNPERLHPPMDLQQARPDLPQLCRNSRRVPWLCPS